MSHSGGDGTETDRQSKAWSSGRVLTDHQRKRKRETDRLRIRRRRQENDEKVRLLEEQLKKLTQVSPKEEIVQLKSDVERLEAENRSLRERWSLDATIVEPNVIAADTPAQSTSKKTRSSYRNDRTLPIATLDEFLHTDSSGVMKINKQRSPNKIPLIDFKDGLSAVPAYQGPPTYRAQPGANPLGNLAAVSANTEAESALQPWSITEMCNSILWSLRTLRAEDICSDDATNQHMLILAIFEGWEAVESRLTFCPLWRILRDVEFVIFSTCNTVERLVMLRMIHLMTICMVKARPFNDLPPWYRPRPAQRRFRHELVMSCFAWPGMRERLVLSQDTQDSILTNEFWKYFAGCFRFYWPFDPTAVFEKDKWTGNYRFSGCFQNYLHEIRMWRMDWEFFSKFPLLLDDICPHEPISPSVCHSITHDFPFRPLETKYPVTEREEEEEIRNLVTLGLPWPFYEAGPDSSRLIDMI